MFQNPLARSSFPMRPSLIIFPDEQVLVFTQWTKILDIMDYYFSEKGFEVCRIDGNVKLDERRRQVFPLVKLIFHIKSILTIS